MSAFPLAPCTLQLPEPVAQPSAGHSPLAYAWHSRQDSEMGGPTAPEADATDVCPPTCMWFPVAEVLLNWAPVEGWESVDGTPVSTETALLNLGEQVPEKAQLPVGQAAWLCLIALRCNMDSVLRGYSSHTETPSQGECPGGASEAVKTGDGNGALPRARGC